MLRVGLTGGLGSGKSTVCGIFAELGVPVIDADQVARDMVEPGMPALAAITREFGPGVVGPDGRLDRPRLRDRVFTDPGARARLEAILHPLIRTEIHRRTAALSAPYCVIAIPLLLESGWQADVDRILVIDAEPPTQLARAQARDGMSRTVAEGILQAQAPREQRLAAADDVIDNNGDLASLREKVTMAHQRYLAMAARR